MRYGFFILMLGIVGCQAFSTTPNQSMVAQKHPYPKGEDYAYHDGGDVHLKILVPDGWETFNTDAGIVLNEQVGATSIDGVLVHIFLPNMNDFMYPDTSDVNLAWSILNQVVSNPDYIGNALVSDPVAFEWDAHDAAYYLLNNRDETVTMLLALGMPTQNSLVVCHVSAPNNQANRIRALLPELLKTLTLDGNLIDAEALESLPDPLVFPEVING